MHEACTPSDGELVDDLESLMARRRRLLRRMARTLEALQEVIDMAGKTAQELLELMRAERTVDGGMMVLLRDLKARVDAAKGNQAAIDTAFAETQADMTAKAAAIIENTPSEEA